MSGGRELLITLKANATANAPYLCIPVGLPVEAVLRPVATAAGRVDAGDVHVLTDWRNRFVSSFLTEFVATEPRTEQWLTEVVGPDPTRILFMLDDALGATVGYLGLAFIDWDNLTGEADAIVRGADTAPGVMARAMFTLLDWAREQLGLKSVGARVRSDNSALRFFLKFATETKRVPLRAVQEPDMIRWIEDETLVDAPISLVYITFTR
jgi:RimJ/RimL family protein N-acetyltransferase